MLVVTIFGAVAMPALCCLQAAEQWAYRDGQFTCWSTTVKGRLSECWCNYGICIWKSSVLKANQESKKEKTKVFLSSGSWTRYGCKHWRSHCRTEQQSRINQPSFRGLKVSHLNLDYPHWFPFTVKRRTPLRITAISVKGQLKEFPSEGARVFLVAAKEALGQFSL